MTGRDRQVPFLHDWQAHRRDRQKHLPYDWQAQKSG